MLQLIAHDQGINPCAAPVAGVRMDLPSAAWTLEELYARASWENDEIQKCRKHATRYWYLGKVLLFLQDQVAEGRWEAWCEAHRVNRNRWQRGRLLALAFQSAENVADLTVQEAVEQAKEILGIEAGQTAAGAKLRRSLTLFLKSLDKSLSEFDSVKTADAVLPRIADVRQKLAELEHACLALQVRTATAVVPRRATKP
ncbi:MAG TPA: hypothetical protein VFI31_28285, partial [Pirellulales bacterium]|nr:hypothetical protein [Pirellulales bacterium]